MTYILGARCSDGVVLVADRKVTYDGHHIRYQRKLFSIGESIIIGASGAVSSFEKSKAELGSVVGKDSKNLTVLDFTRLVEEITDTVNKRYMYKLHREVFDVLIAIYTPISGVTLQYVAPEGYSEEVTNYRVIGEGEPYGSIYLSQLWHQHFTMTDGAELGYRLINYIERFRLNDSVGVANHKPQVLFFTKDGIIREASDLLLTRFDTSSQIWLDRIANSLREMYKPAFSIDDYIFLRKWGEHGYEPPKFFFTEGIDIDSCGNVYVVAEAPHCVQKFDSSGKFIKSWGARGSGNSQFNVPYALAIDSLDNVYVSDSDNSRIQKFDSDGKFILKWGKEGKDISEFQHPIGVAIDNQENVYIADHLNHRIQVFDPDGKFKMKWGTQGKGDGQFDRPHGITFDLLNNLYVTDSLNHRVQLFTNQGKFITRWGSEGSDDGQFRVPRDLAVDSSDSIYISDGGNHRIQVFGPARKHASNLDLFNEAKDF